MISLHGPGLATNSFVKCIHAVPCAAANLVRMVDCSKRVMWKWKVNTDLWYATTNACIYLKYMCWAARLSFGSLGIYIYIYIYISRKGEREKEIYYIGSGSNRCH